jgi:hypothetical protein
MAGTSRVVAAAAEGYVAAAATGRYEGQGMRYK